MGYLETMCIIKRNKENIILPGTQKIQLFKQEIETILLFFF